MIGVPLSGPASIPSDVEVAAVDIRKLNGTVKEANGVAVANAIVRVYQKDTDELVGIVIAAANGTWSLNVNYYPGGFYAICFVPNLAVTVGFAIGPLFTQ